jgi:integrase
MKAAVEHRVPLSPAAVAILKAAAPLQAAPDGLVFPGGRKGAPLSDVAVSKALAAVAAACTVHGMRSAFRDWAAESTNYPREVAEAALAHTNRDKVEAAYRRSDLFEQRARLMADWGGYCVPLRKGRDIGDKAFPKTSKPRRRREAEGVHTPS